MNASILVFSQTGNTLKVGNSIAQGLKDSGVEVDITRFLQRKKWNPKNAQLLGIGCPVFENRPAEVVPGFLNSGDFDFKGKKAFVFITSGGSPAKSLWHLSKAVSQTGAEIIGGIQIRGTSSFPTLFGLYPDRPNTSDLRAAQEFGSAMAATISDGQDLPDEYKIDPKQGSVFYDRVGPVMNYTKKLTTPLPACDHDKCDLCGTCVKECPSESISVEDKTIAFHKGCIVCYRCWHICPQSAISIPFSPGSGLIERTMYCESMERWFGDTKKDEYVGTNLYKDVLARKIRLKYNRKNPTAQYERILEE